MISYYKEDREYELLNIIELSKIHAVSPVQGKSKIFGIVTKERTFYLECESEVEMNSWISIIGQQMEDIGEKPKKTLTNPILLPAPTFLANSMERLSTVDSISPNTSAPVKVPGITRKPFRAQSVTQNLPVSKSNLARSWSSYLPSGDQDQNHEIKFQGVGPSTQFQTKVQLDKVWCQGFVYKLNSGIGMKTWKRYWFVLRGGKLISYKNQLVP